jgi:TonB family protein
VERPGARAAERGGGAPGGPASWTGRRDDPADATLLAEPWNDGRAYRAAHDRTSARTASREAIHRTPAPASGDRAIAPLARDGTDVPSRGGATGQGAGDGDAAWRDADPRFGLRPGRDQAVRADGATRPTRDPVLAERGAASADVTTRGAATRDREAVAAASRETIPDRYDLTPVQAGGADRGVRGAAGAGALPDGRGAGDAASRADVAAGARDLAIEARRQDPYFRKLYVLIDRAVRFPRDLAVDLRSGRTVARFVLAADGSISDIALHASSGFRGFDDELVRALRSLPSLPPAPATLLDGRSELHVRVSYEFRNPVVR